MKIATLGYRAWTGERRSPAVRFWPIARVGWKLVLSRKIFRLLLLAALTSFLFASAMVYLLSQPELQPGRRALEGMANRLVFTGTGTAYQEFIFLQGIEVMLMLALAGGLLVGGDFRSNAVAFYLARPLSKLDYFLGKLLATSGLAALITLVPALVLFLEYGAFTESFAYYYENLRILRAILVYGFLVSVVPAVILLGIASALRRTIPIVIAWGGLFIFVPSVVEAIRAAYRFRDLPDPWGWALLDLWRDLRWLSNALFGVREEVYNERWPYAAAAVLAACAISFLAFWRRISAAEVVR